MNKYITFENRIRYSLDEDFLIINSFSGTILIENFSFLKNEQGSFIIKKLANNTVNFYCTKIDKETFKTHGRYYCQPVSQIFPNKSLKEINEIITVFKDIIKNLNSPLYPENFFNLGIPDSNGIAIGEFPSCCGAQFIYDFPYNKKEKIKNFTEEQFFDEQLDASSLTLSILQEDRQNQSIDFLIKRGFKKITTFLNEKTNNELSVLIYENQ